MRNEILSRSATYLKVSFYKLKLIPKIERALLSYLMNLKTKYKPMSIPKKIERLAFWSEAYLYNRAKSAQTSI